MGTPKEFWEAEMVDTGEDDLSDEEHTDFRKLDTDGDGHITLEELRAWESGRFHTEEAMKTLVGLVDKDHDMHITADELVGAKEEIAASDAHYHLLEWSSHEEL